MEAERQLWDCIGRRSFLKQTGLGLGSIALASLLDGDQSAKAQNDQSSASLFPQFAARAKRVIYLFQSGAPSQLDLFDYKPGLKTLQGADLPAESRLRHTHLLSGTTEIQQFGDSFEIPQVTQLHRRTVGTVFS